ncbi:hypothetical protein BTW28_17440 [Citrobacter freundii]|nr:hypothetical protein BTW28_17440 [Citrobacter freundii]
MLKSILLRAFLSSVCADINKFRLHFRVFFTDVVTFRLVIVRITLFFSPCGDKRVSFVSILFFAHVGIYERDHKQTFGSGALLGDLALFYVAVGE